jgi:hypothetical protein
MMDMNRIISLTPTLMGLLSNRLSPQAGKSLLISRTRERGQAMGCARPNRFMMRGKTF